MAAGRSKAGFFPVKTTSGGPAQMEWFPLVGATAYYEGQLLRMNTVGSAVKITSITGTTVLGVAGADVKTSATTTSMPVFIADNNTIFEAQAQGVQASNAASYRRKLVDLYINTIHNHRLAVGTSTSKLIRMIQGDPAGSGTAAGRKYWVKFNTDYSVDVGGNRGGPTTA